MKKSGKKGNSIFSLILVSLAIFIGLAVSKFDPRTLNSSTDDSSITQDKPITAEEDVKGVTEDPDQDDDLYTVSKIVDGDTIKVKVPGGESTIRMLGIDAPESKTSTRPVECFGAEATKKLEELLAGKKVKLIFDETQGNQDRYGRYLRYVFLEDGTDINKEMIKLGYVFEYTYDDPYKFQIVYKNAEKEARESKVGLWSPSTCNGES